MEKLEKAVKKIIMEIEPGRYFDTHTIILLLFKNYHDVYLTSIGNYTTTKTYHSAISKMVGANKELAELAGNSFSKNVFDHFSECHLWYRKKKETSKAKTVTAN